MQIYINLITTGHFSKYLKYKIHTIPLFVIVVVKSILRMTLTRMLMK